MFLDDRGTKRRTSSRETNANMGRRIFPPFCGHTYKINTDGKKEYKRVLALYTTAASLPDDVCIAVTAGWIRKNPNSVDVVFVITVAHGNILFRG